MSAFPAVALQQTPFASATIQPFQQADLTCIVANERDASPYPWSEADLKQSLESTHICLGLKQTDEWLAHAVLSSVAGDAEILIFTVAKARQGQGIGAAFLSALLEWLTQKNERVFLEVRASNSAAIALYEGLGFCCLGERPNYYPLAGSRGREDALLYGIELLAG